MNDILDLLCHTIYKVQGGFEIHANNYIDSANTTNLANFNAQLLLERAEASEEFSRLPANLKFRFRSLDGDLWNQGMTITESYGGGDTTISNSTKDVAVYNIFDPCHNDADTYKTSLEDLTDDIATIFFDSYGTHNLNNAIYFGVLPVNPAPDCHYFEYFHDVRDNKYKTLIKSFDVTKHMFPEISRETETIYHILDETGNGCASGSGASGSVIH